MIKEGNINRSVPLTKYGSTHSSRHQMDYWWVILQRCQSLDCIRSNGNIADNKMKGIWKETVVLYVLSIKHLSIFLKRLRNTMKYLSFLVEIIT
jgi:hypothetical protein